MTHTSAAARQPAAKPSFIALLIAASAVSPLGINMYLPSMPGMARAFGVDFATIQLTLSLYLAAMAIGQLIIGPLSDRFGRRPMLLAGLLVFVFGSFVCLTAQNVGMLIIGRIVQAIGGCAGITLSRAIVRDLYGRNQVASMIGYVTMGMAVAPMIAPTIGGVLETLYGWRASFVFLMVFGSLILVVAYWQLRETNHNRDAAGSVRHLMHSYLTLFGSRLFWGYTLSASFVSAVFFAFVAGAPYVMIELMGRSPAEYGFYFAIVPSGYILGNFASGRFAGRIGPNRMILAGTLVTLASVASMAVTFALGFLHPVALFAPMFFIGLGNGLVLPSGIAGAVSVKPEVAGAAAGLSGSLQIGFGALVAPVVGATLGATVWPLITIMVVCALFALASFGLVAERRRASSAAGP
ncbi:multidrug effflux MFS transporter [Microvirga makkahensis]|uniref:Bcr/CflA family efflux transporter n=1 Tax=Microvirga makkahensis TaxID=1128670 RepID=A0A7X3MS40_9HYPH|nr:multidrug effflux MFS transporter [Microvirga makkahensis]MXQ12207.1 Bcr/CflA family efflux MFS transporter [Microvirga makkahensis]